MSRTTAWTCAKLGEVSAEIQYGYSASARVGAEGPRLLRITDIQDGTVDWPQVPSCRISATDLEKYRLGSGDIVFARTGATTGKSFLIEACPVNAVFASYLIRVRVDRKVIVPGFLIRFFQSAQYWAHISSSVAGIAQPNCNASKLADLQVPLPPLSEQKRVADKLDALLARVDACRERLDRVPAILKRFRQSVLAAAMTGRLTRDWRRSPVPEGWTSAPLSELGELKLGKMLDRARNQGVSTRYLRNLNVRWFDFDLGDVATVPVSSEERRKYSIQLGDLLICEGGEPGRCAIWGEQGEQEFIYQKALHRFRSNGRVVPSFLMFQIKFAAESGALEQLFTGTTIKHLTKESLGRFSCTLPSIEEQREIVVRIEKLFARADEVENRLVDARAAVNLLATSILAKAFRGELVPQDPNDEPATELLARIRRENQQIEETRLHKVSKRPEKPKRRRSG